ncbi:MAG: glycosyltransferase [Acidobacteria bacterium]|nr:glycosyltransferase [Acidobacteriota bacterium]
MTKPAGSSSRALFLTPEALYPKIGGGALRAASIFEYLLTRHQVDVIAFREDAREVQTPGASETLVLDLPHHARHALARGHRNLRRSVTGRPPLLDRYSGFDRQIAQWLKGRHYDVAVVEHFWCAPYAAVLRPHVRRLVLDLHNIESTLQATTAAASRWPLSLPFRRFAEAYRKLEARWLPAFDDVLAASGADASRVPAERVSVYPNTIPYAEKPHVKRDHAIAFTGNLEYDPNVSAVRWFASEIWPRIRRADPTLEWRLIGRNAHAIAKHVRGVEGAVIVGEVADAIHELAKAKAAVVPLLAGSGTRFKILEAWAAGAPVVSTTIGAEGLGAVPGHHLLIANEPQSFAEAVHEALRRPAPLIRHGRELYEERYTTESGQRLLEALGL